MEILPATDVIARIEAVRAKVSDGVVAFDGDGTLWSGDIGDDFFHALVARADFREIACRAMKEEAIEFQMDSAGDGATLVRRIFDAYEQKRFPEERMYELVAWACAGWTRGEVDRFAVAVLEGLSLRARLHREVVRAVEWARAVGVEVYVVSASPRAIVEQAAGTLGIAASHVVAATPAYHGETMHCSVERPIPYGAGKVARLRMSIGGRPLYAAFGDNAFDVAMLKESLVPVAVRPKARLRDRAHEVPNLIELTPED